MAQIVKAETNKSTSDGRWRLDRHTDTQKSCFEASGLCRHCGDGMSPSAKKDQ